MYTLTVLIYKISEKVNKIYHFKNNKNTCNNYTYLQQFSEYR